MQRSTAIMDLQFIPSDEDEGSDSEVKEVAALERDELENHWEFIDDAEINSEDIESDASYQPGADEAGDSEIDSEFDLDDDEE